MTLKLTKKTTRAISEIEQGKSIFVGLTLLIILNFSASAQLAPGSLDPTFDGEGIVITSVTGFNDAARSVAVQSDGKIVVGGFYSASNEADFVVVRYNPNGSLDTAFDGDGIAIVSIDVFDSAQCLTIQPDGKIVVAGNAVNTATSFRGLALVRLNPSGALDTTFDGDGKVTAPYGNFGFIRSVALQPDGKIVLAGNISDGVDSNSLFYRYNADGSPDTSFDGDGKAVVELSAFDDDMTAVAVQPDGKIVGGGFGILMRAPNVFEDDFMVVRLNTNGSPDTSFDGDGRLNTPIGPNLDRALGMALQSDGKIVLSGFTQDLSFNLDVATVRYNSDGSLDASFDGDGKIITPIGAGNDFGTSVKIQSDNKIVVGGFGSNGSNNDFAVIRYNADGSLDTSFDGDGKVLTPVGSADDQANAVAIQADGKILLAGTSRVGTNDDFSLVRYLSDSTAPRRAPFDFDGDGKTDVGIFRPSGAEWWYTRSLDNQVAAVQFGASNDKPVPADFTGDGKADVAFFRPSTSEWFILRSEDGSFYSFPFGASGDIPVVGDFDADGKADAGVFRPSSATWFINKSSGGTIIQQFGAASDKPIVADYDGDGKADIAIWRAGGANGAEWWYQRSSDLQVAALQFGSSADKPLPGDYTGDGKADIAFFQPSTGFWYVLRSEDYSYYAFPFGVAGDTPAPGDYDGDGKIDPAVFRPSTATWFIQRSTSGTTIQQFGAAGDVPLPGVFIP
jgi:uncharacterized delta-60 repeat protein